MPHLNFTEADWDRVERDTLAWWAGELDRPLVYLSSTDPVPSDRPYEFASNYPLDLPAEAVVDSVEPLLAATHYYGDAFPAWWMNFGPGIMAGFLGGEVHSVADPSETVWFTPPKRVRPASGVRPPGGVRRRRRCRSMIYTWPMTPTTSGGVGCRP